MRDPMPIHLLILSFAVISGCAARGTSADSGDLHIRNFRQGLMHSRVYEEGSRFTYRDNGPCVVKGRVESRCMWYGFEFNFDASQWRSRLSCTTTFSEPTYLVSPRKRATEPQSTATYTVTLRGFSGRFAHPEYQVGASEPSNLLTICSHSGKEVLRFQMTID
jgi:hypothetical protein